MLAVSEGLGQTAVAVGSHSSGEEERMGREAQGKMKTCPKLGFTS